MGARPRGPSTHLRVRGSMHAAVKRLWAADRRRAKRVAPAFLVGGFGRRAPRSRASGTNRCVPEAGATLPHTALTRCQRHAADSSPWPAHAKARLESNPRPLTRRHPHTPTNAFIRNTRHVPAHERFGRRGCAHHTHNTQGMPLPCPSNAATCGAPRTHGTSAGAAGCSDLRCDRTARAVFRM